MLLKLLSHGEKPSLSILLSDKVVTGNKLVLNFSKINVQHIVQKQAKLITDELLLGCFT